MNFEQSPSKTGPEHTRERKETSKRLLLALEANIKPLVGEITVIGREHIDEIPENKKVVIATSHMSDLDIPITAKVLGHDFDIAISDVSTHHHFNQDPQGNISIRLAGKDNFVPIDYRLSEEGKQPVFNPDNFTAMAEAMEGGKDIIVAAQNPSADDNMTRAGVGAVYLAQLSGATILPVAVHMKSPFLVGKNAVRTLKNRSDVDVSIGTPITLEPIEGIEQLKEIFDKRKQGERLSPEERVRFSELSAQLKAQAETILHIITSLIPDDIRS